MRKLLFMQIMAFLFLVCTTVSAGPETNSPFPLVSWGSKSNSEVVTIQNGSFVALMVMITVTGGPNAAGVSVRNCGVVTHIDPGSSSVCFISDPTRPVSFNSDNSNVPAAGTYQITPINRYY